MKTRKRSKSLPIVLVHEQEPVPLQMYSESRPPRRSLRLVNTTSAPVVPQEAPRSRRLSNAEPLFRGLSEPRKSRRLSNAEPLFSGLSEPRKSRRLSNAEPLFSGLSEPKRPRRYTNGDPLFSRLSEPRKSRKLSNAQPLFSGLSEVKKKDKKIPDREVLRRSPEYSRNSSLRMALVEVDTPASADRKVMKQKSDSYLIGDPIPAEEAQQRWEWRYKMKDQRSKGKDSAPDDDEDKIVSNVECHYAQARIGECIFDLGDCAYIKGEGTQKHIGKILEFFITSDAEEYFRVQWFYRAEDTVMKEAADFHDGKRLFYSSIKNDNPIDCIISKVVVTQIPPLIGLKSNSTPPSDFYFDMEYCVEYSTFRTMLTDNSSEIHDLSLPSIEMIPTTGATTFLENTPSHRTCNAELALLDLYSGCGGMSSGLCLGTKLSCIDLVTRWALDHDKSACESLKLNHPETKVRNEPAEDFLELLKEWKKLCKRFAVNKVEGEKKLCSVSLRVSRNNTSSSIVTSNSTGSPRVTRNCVDPPRVTRNSVDSPKVTRNSVKFLRVTRNNVSSPRDVDISPGEYEVERLVDICYGDPNKSGKRGLTFKVHWKGYSKSEDSWEPIEGLRNCPDRIKEFVRNGLKSKILPLPGDVDVICGGPPCQGISGYNRFRNVGSPLDDQRNRQIVIFMDIVEFLKPKYVLMENVVDILKFDKASLGRYALSRLVHMSYQARFGIIAASCYGLPQFRLRFFIWGAHPSEKLPQFPLPTHDVIMKYWPPPEFEHNTVAYDEGQPRELERAVVLQDAISDLPSVTSHEAREEMLYEKPPETEFQRFIRSGKSEMAGCASDGTARVRNMLYDHRPYQLSEDDYIRVCQIPKRKGANFRDLPGVVVGADNVARRTKEQMLLPSGKPMIPDYALNFEQGKSKRPFARLWWDEAVGTVVTFPNLHCMAVLHPEQDRVLTIREFARLQGFPDYYRFCGTVKERYCQVGNAVPVVVSRALGYALGMALKKLSRDEPLMTLPLKFSLSTNLELASTLFQKTD